MKKLMLAFAVVVIAAVTNAASVNWTASNVYQGWTGGDASAKASGVVGYLFFADEISVADMTAALSGAEGAKYTMAEALAKGYSAQTSSSAGKYAGSATPTDVPTSYHGNTMDAYAVIFNAATTDTASYFYIMPETSKSIAATGSTAFAFGTQDTASAKSSSWTAVAPEPTSGLLMLVGLAGLALRRRRA